jgi:hypothetical protein
MEVPDYPQTQYNSKTQYNYRVIPNVTKATSNVTTVTEMQTVTKRVKRCDRGQCFYETITYQVPVTRTIPINTVKKVVAPKATSIDALSLVNL